MRKGTKAFLTLKGWKTIDCEGLRIVVHSSWRDGETPHDERRRRWRKLRIRWSGKLYFTNIGCFVCDDIMQNAHIVVQNTTQQRNRIEQPTNFLFVNLNSYNDDDYGMMMVMLMIGYSWWALVLTINIWADSRGDSFWNPLVKMKNISWIVLHSFVGELKGNAFWDIIGGGQGKFNQVWGMINGGLLILEPA